MSTFPLFRWLNFHDTRMVSDPSCTRSHPSSPPPFRSNKTLNLYKTRERKHTFAGRGVVNCETKESCALCLRVEFFSTRLLRANQQLKETKAVSRPALSPRPIPSRIRKRGSSGACLFPASATRGILPLPTEVHVRVKGSALNSCHLFVRIHLSTASLHQAMGWVGGCALGCVCARVRVCQIGTCEGFFSQGLDAGL